MNNQHFMNSKKKKKVYEILREQFSYQKKLPYIFLMNDKNRIYVINKKVSEIISEIQKLKLNTMGLYFGELFEDEIRLSIEGSQIIGPDATLNLIEITKKESRQWLKGSELYSDYPSTKFIIIKSGNDYMGCGKIRNRRVLNFVAKTRRIKCSD